MVMALGGADAALARTGSDRSLAMNKVLVWLRCWTHTGGVDLRVSRFDDTDLVAVGLWPGTTGTGPGVCGGCASGMPAEVRCLDRATAEALIAELVDARVPRPLNLTRREMHTLIDRAEQRRRGPG